MRSDSVKNMSAYADQNHAPSLAAARLELHFHTVLVHLSFPQNSLILQFLFSRKSISNSINLIYSSNVFGRPLPLKSIFPHQQLTLLQSSVTKSFKKRNKRIPICNLGAIIGCERLSEHSTRRDESHRQGLFIFYEASVSEYKYSYCSTS